MSVLKKHLTPLLVLPAILSGMLLPSCANHDEAPVPETAWEKFVGEYRVTKLETGESYTMKVSFDTLPITGASEETDLHIIYENFDNSFDSLVGQFPNGTPVDEKQIAGFSAPFGVYDDVGHRWALSMHYYNSFDNPFLLPSNTLVNDTILFNFSKSNIAFYAGDNVAYYSCECQHLAVKVE
ncbi:MAG: hypothetical protein K9J17_16890 [Flavobacteriales bacterium]|nr:hypothetical protein [Flavobacteriales bacterium]